MSKKIHTIQSSDKKEFDKEVNLILELGGELVDGGYQVINSDDDVVYSQVIVFKNNCEVEFYEDGELKLVRYKNEDGRLDGLYTEWYWNGQKKSEGTYKDGQVDQDFNSWYNNGVKKFEGSFKDGKKDGLFTWWYGNGKKEYEGTYKDGKKISVKEWNEDGSIKE